MPNTYETLSAIEGDLKVVYLNELTQVLPDVAIMQRRFKLKNGGNFPAVGDYFSAVVPVQLPWGISFLGIGTEGTATNITLGPQLAGQTKPAKIYANTMVLADNIAYQVLDRAKSSGGPQSVVSALTLTGEQMAISARNVLELQILHGREGLGASAGAISTLTVTFDGATTSVGILSTLVGARLQWMQSNLTSARTANDSSNYLTVSAVSVANPASPTLTMVATGTTNYAAITTGDVMYIGGSRGVSVASSDTSVPHYEQFGLGLQLAQTGGSMFDIARTYVGWSPNQTGSVGPMSPSVLMNAAATVMSRGAELGKYLAVMHTDAWAVLNSALATNEVYTSQSGWSMSKKTGTDDITINNGGVVIECVPHPFQKRGSIFVFPEKEFHRIGSTDLTFAIPGRPDGEEFFFPLEGLAAMQRQCRADFQCALLKPPAGVILTGIAY